VPGAIAAVLEQAKKFGLLERYRTKLLSLKVVNGDFIHANVDNMQKLSEIAVHVYKTIS